MLSREQANQIGSELIEQAEALRLEKKNAKVRRISFFYRFPELQAFALSERPGRLQEARTATMRKPAMIVVWLFFSVLTIAAALYSLKYKPLGRLPPIAYWPAMAILMSPVFFYQRTLMRHHIRAEALARHGNAAAAGAGD